MLTALLLLADTSLELRPDLGDAATYAVTRTWTYPDEQDFQLVWLDEYKVTARQKSSNGQLVLEYKITPQSITIDKQDFSSTKPEPWQFRETRNALGQLISRTEDPEDGPLMERYSTAFSIIFPKEKVKVGSSWQAARQGDLETGASGWKFDYKWESQGEASKRQLATLRISFQEDRKTKALAGTAIVRIDLASGLLFDGTYDFTHALVPGDEEEATTRLKMTLINKSFSSSAKLAE